MGRGRLLPRSAVGSLMVDGFVVLPGPLGQRRMTELQRAYDFACSTASSQDVRVGRTSTRISDVVDRDAIFESIYTWPPALDAARRIVGPRFRLSAFHARTLHPRAHAQALHADVPRTSDAWPMLGLILMVDEFRAENGATRFIPGSQRRTESPEDVLVDPSARHPEEILARGAAGSIILFDASTWHGHTGNSSAQPRRSLQATYIPYSGRPATDFRARMRPEVIAGLGPTARELLGLGAETNPPPV